MPLEDAASRLAHALEQSAGVSPLASTVASV
jgi:hypothetical protein